MPPKTKNICKKILHNPFFIALMLTVLAMIIIVAVFKNSNYGGASNIFKSGFYMFIAFSLILFLNNMFLKKTIESTQIKTEVKEVFTGIDMSKEMSHDVIHIEPNLYEENYKIYEEKKIGGNNFKNVSDTVSDTDSVSNNISNNNVSNNNDDNISNNNVSNNNSDNISNNNGDNISNNNDDNISNNNDDNISNNNVSNNGDNSAPENIPTDVNSILDSIVKIET